MDEQKVEQLNKEYFDTLMEDFKVRKNSLLLADYRGRISLYLLAIETLSISLIAFKYLS